MHLQPFDVVLGLRLIRPAGTLAQLATELSVAPSQVHTALGRLGAAGLVRPGTREANRHALAEFVMHGVRYAFPASVGSERLGVPTAQSADILAKDIAAGEAYVWPASGIAGAIRGYAIAPLYRGAIQLREKSPQTYQLAALVDALRVGGGRERALAKRYLEEVLESAAAP